MDNDNNMSEGSLGQKLKSYREAMSLSIDDVHQHTKIPLNKLALLESEQFDKLGGPVFVSGYIRSYAKVVHADAGELVELFQGLTGQFKDEGVLAERSVTAASDAKVSSLVSSLKAAPFVLVVVGLICLWMFVTLMVSSEDNLAPDSADVERVVEAPLVHDDGQVLIQHSDDMAVDVEAVGIANAETLSEMPAQVSDTLDDLLEPVSVSDTDNVEPVSNQASLAFEFTEECWLEVKYANDVIMFADIQNKGDNPRLFGLAPFKVMLGNAKAASILVDGTPVQLNIVGLRKTLKLTVNKP